MYDYDLEDPDLDFGVANTQVARALKEAAALKNADAPGLTRDGRGNLYFSQGANIGHIFDRLTGTLNQNQAEKQQRAISAEEKRRFADLSKQLVTPGTKKAKVLKQTLEGPVDPNNPAELMSQVEQDVPLSPEEENQRQMAVGTRLLGLRSGKFMGQEAVRAGMMFPEKMAELRMRQEQQNQLQAERLQNQRDMQNQRLEQQIFLKSLAGGRGGGGGGGGGGRRSAASGGALPLAVGGGTSEDGEVVSGVGLTQLPGQIDPLGRQMFRNKVGDIAVIGPGGKPIRLGSGGARITAAGSKADEQDAQLLELATRADKSAMDQPDAFGVKTLVPNFILQRVPGQGGAKADARRDVAHLSAEEAHKLYGASFSVSEQRRAAKFLPEDGDTPEEVKRKTAGMLALVQESIARRKAERDQQRTGKPADKPADKAVTVKSQAEWENLKPGTRYTTPDGKTGVR
jgi:hypothetical protein